MIFNKYGRIINISSIAGTNALPFEVLYSSSKAALIGLTKGIAKEYASKGVTCNVIAPGVIDTGAGNYDDIKKSIPTSQIGSPEDVAGLVAYLSSEEAAYITGQVIKIDGGLFI
jgi:3-oxoacyl-[acyl-carrier protein] reductase